jgi:hypothetical protein
MYDHHTEPLLSTGKFIGRVALHGAATGKLLVSELIDQFHNMKH